MIKNVVEREIARMHRILAEGGLPGCYVDFGDFLCDFYADFSWNEPDSKAEATKVLACQEFVDLATKVKEAYQFDFISALTELRDLDPCDDTPPSFSTCVPNPNYVG